MLWTLFFVVLGFGLSLFAIGYCVQFMKQKDAADLSCEFDDEDDDETL